MIKKLKLFILSISSLIMFAVPLGATATVSAAIDQNQINNQLCAGSNGDFSGGTNSAPCTTSGQAANSLVTTIINVLSLIVGVVAVIMIIIAGFRYIASGGKQESVTGAKNTILYAIVGLVIVALAQLIVHFVLGKTTAATSNS
jgi:hypothetical protein